MARARSYCSAAHLAPRRLRHRRCPHRLAAAAWATALAAASQLQRGSACTARRETFDAPLRPGRGNYEVRSTK